MVATTSLPRSAETAAQEQRLPQLLDEVMAGALCASRAPGIPEPDEWHRADGEPLLDWRRRRTDLLTVCAACPVRAACAESALRQGEGCARVVDDLVRGGMTGTELYEARTKQSARLAAAARADELVAAEEQHINRLAQQLRVLAVVDRAGAGENETANEHVRAKAAELHTARAARRARSGWTSAA
jgi:WhiB family redox-sensing transcriptional regulator